MPCALKGWCTRGGSAHVGCSGGMVHMGVMCIGGMVHGKVHRDGCAHGE